MESDLISLWQHLLSYRSPETNALTLRPKHGLLKLSKFSFQINGREGECYSLIRILDTLLQCPSLTELRVLGAMGGHAAAITQGPTFKNLQRLEIYESGLSLRSLDAIISLCENLRHLICHWYFLWCSTAGQEIELLPNLSKHRDTLETLWLVADRADIEGFLDASQFKLSQMSVLKEVNLCNFFIPDEHDRSPHPPDQPAAIAPELPPSVERLLISYTLECLRVGVWRRQVTESLLQLAEDCPRLLPCLKEVTVSFEGGILGIWGQANTPIVKAFAGKGVQLTIVGEIDFVGLLATRMDSTH